MVKKIRSKSRKAKTSLCENGKKPKRNGLATSQGPFNPFPVVKLPRLKRAPIELIVGQVRVPMIASLLDPNNIATFQSLARKTYPHLKREDQVALRFSPDEGPRGETVKLWRFEDSSHDWTLTVTPEFVAIEAREYRNFGEFRDRLVKAAEWYAEAYDCTLRTRVGLRYVDRFSKEKYEYLRNNWIDGLNPALLTLAKKSPDREQRTFIEHRFDLGDRYGLTLRLTAAFGDASDNAKSEVVLDVDAYDQNETSFDNLSSTLDALKLIDNSAFAWAADGLLNSLERKE